MKRLGINIDHIATLRNARAENHPNIMSAAKFAMKCGAALAPPVPQRQRRHAPGHGGAERARGRGRPAARAGIFLTKTIFKIIKNPLNNS